MGKEDEVAKKKIVPVPLESPAEQVMDQYFYSLGAGGSPQWISRKALSAVRQHYFPAIEQAIGAAAKGGGPTWEEAAPRVLDYLRAIGQLAGSLALEAGRHMIEVKDVRRAIRKVESNYNVTESVRKQGGVDPVGAGIWCPAPPKG